MHTVELLELAIAVARRLGIGVRQELLGGGGTACCELHGRRWLFLDLADDSSDQLAVALEALRKEPAVVDEVLDPRLAQALGLGFRRSA